MTWVMGGAISKWKGMLLGAHGMGIGRCKKQMERVSGGAISKWNGK